MPTFVETFGPADAKTARTCTFDVLPGTKEILIRGDFQPRSEPDAERSRQLVVECMRQYLADDPELDALTPAEAARYEESFLKLIGPVSNQFNYTLVDPDGRHRANGHKRFLETVQLSEEKNSLGCQAGDITPGEWKLHIEAKAVVTEDTEVTMDVRLNQSITDAVAATEQRLQEEESFGSFSLEPREHWGGPGWYKGDLHSHTHHSDGSHSLAEVMAALYGRGYDFMVLSDHNTAVGYRHDLAEHMLVIPGVEVTTFHGHAVAVNCRSLVEWHGLSASDTLVGLTSKLRSEGALLSVAHPYCVGDPLCSGCRWDYTEFNWQAADLVEVWAGGWYERRFENRKTLALWERLLEQGYRVTAVGATDTHVLGTDSTDFGMTYVYAQSYSIAGILEGLRRGQVYVSSGPEFSWQAVSEAGEPVHMGSVAISAPGELWDFRGRVSCVPRRARLELVSGGAVVESQWITDEAAAFSWQRRVEHHGWYYLRLFDGRGRLLAFTNPVYMNCVR